jgi:hypothetical protein
MAGQKAKKGKKQRKFGRNAQYCATYAAAGIEARNAKRKLRRHLRRQPDDTQALRAFVQLGGKEAAIR